MQDQHGCELFDAALQYDQHMLALLVTADISCEQSDSLPGYMMPMTEKEILLDTSNVQRIQCVFLDHQYSQRARQARLLPFHSNDSLDAGPYEFEIPQGFSEMQTKAKVSYQLSMTNLFEGSG
jgi:hypothetical protein